LRALERRPPDFGHRFSPFELRGSNLVPVDRAIRAGTVERIPVSDAAKNPDIHARQIAIYRSMSPERRLAEGLKMNRMMRELMARGFRQRNPGWSDAEIARAVADRILHARTG
jgi:hypothetical protein